MLAAISHGKIEGEPDVGDWNRMRLSIQVQNVSPCAKIDFSASECVAIQKDRVLLDDEEKLYDEAQKWSKGKYNALREGAALDLRVRVVERVERGGKWMGV